MKDIQIYKQSPILPERAFIGPGMTRSPKKLRRLLRNRDIGLDDLPVEHLRGRQVRKMVMVANTILAQMEKERQKRNGLRL